MKSESNDEIRFRLTENHEGVLTPESLPQTCLNDWCFGGIAILSSRRNTGVSGDCYGLEVVIIKELARPMIQGLRDSETPTECLSV